MKITREQIQFLDDRGGGDLVMVVSDFKDKFNLTDHQAFELWKEWAELPPTDNTEQIMYLKKSKEQGGSFQAITQHSFEFRSKCENPELYVKFCKVSVVEELLKAYEAVVDIKNYYNCYSSVEEYENDMNKALENFKTLRAKVGV